jgi:hypothetical protein
MEGLICAGSGSSYGVGGCLLLSISSLLRCVLAIKLFQRLKMVRMDAALIVFGRFSFCSYYARRSWCIDMKLSFLEGILDVLEPRRIV